jgi:hypothetical protein
MLPKSSYIILKVNFRVFTFFEVVSIFGTHDLFIVGRDSSVGIATHYELDRGIESRWGRDFSEPSKSALPPIQWLPGLFSGGKAAGAWS